MITAKPWKERAMKTRIDSAADRHRQVPMKRFEVMDLLDTVKRAKALCYAA